MMANELVANIEAALEATAGEPEPVRAAAVQGAASAPLPLPSSDALGFVWRALVVGLVVVLIVSLVGIILIVRDGSDQTNPEVLVTVFTASLAGLLGLFVQSPS
jgi:hypothetical protein